MTDAEITAEKQKRVIGKPFEKGVSGNPAGRPKGTFSITTIVHKRLKEHPEELDELITKLINLRPDKVWDKTDPNPPQDFNFQGNWQPIQINIIKSE